MSWFTDFWRTLFVPLRLGLGGGSSGSTTTVQKADPWAGVQPYLSSAYGQTANLYQNPSNFPQYYPGEQVAPLTGQQTGAINSAVNYGLTPSPMLQTASNAIQNVSSGANVNANPVNSILQPYTSGQMLSTENPYFQNMAQQVSQAVQPAVNSSFEAAGRYGSGANANALSSALANEIGNLGFQNYQQGQQNQLTAAQNVGQAYESGAGQQLQAAMLAPSNYAAPITGISTALSASAIPQTQQQNEINALMNKWNYNQQLPFMMNSSYLQNLQGASPYATQSTTQPYFTNQAAGALGGALAGYSLAPALGMTGPVGAGIGLLGGLLL